MAYHTSLIRAMSQVLVHGPWLALCAANWNARRGSVIQKSVTSREALVEFWHSPRSNDLDLGLQSIERKLEANLVVTLSSATMADRKAPLLLRNSDLRSGNDGAGKRCAKQVDVLVDGIALHSWEAKLLNELLSQILNIARNGTNLHRFRLGSLKVLCVIPLSASNCVSWSILFVSVPS